jgi:pimeloyl-ACP methyl ester carboxylesterase
METLTLPDGRLLDLDAGDGDPTLPVAVAHHGTPGAGTRDRHLDAAAAAVGLRVVTFSRAGYGGSTRHVGRSVADVATDVTALLDHLGVERCVTLGASGGGPHALATAALLPERVTGVLCLAGVAPWEADGLDFLAGMGEDNLEEFALALRGEDALRPWLADQARDLREATPAQIVDSLTSLLPQVDRDAILDPRGAGLGEDLAASFAEALRRDVDGWVDDDLAFTRDWGFDLAALGAPAFVWQGDADLMVPASHGAWLAQHVPGAAAHLLPGEGHVSITLGHAEQMLAELGATLAR